MMTGEEELNRVANAVAEMVIHNYDALPQNGKPLKLQFTCLAGECCEFYLSLIFLLAGEPTLKLILILFLFQCHLCLNRNCGTHSPSPLPRQSCVELSQQQQC
mgnify:CR=1 FL=1